MNRAASLALCIGLIAAVTPVVAEEPATPATPPTANVPPSVTEPGPPEDSFPPFVNGKTTVDEVTATFGRPTSEGHLFGPGGPFNYTYMQDNGNIMIIFLFTKDGVLVRVRAYRKNT